MKTKILVLEDEASIRSFIRIKLKGFGYEVLEAETGKEALAKIDDTIDIALLDVMLPDIDGFEVCRQFRMNYPKLGIIMITAMGMEEDKITGLGNGADDYIVKPFSPKELVARIESLLRRININKSNEEIKSSTIKHGRFILDTDKRILKKNDKLISLTPTEYSILEFLMSYPNKVFSRDEILDRVWGKNYFGDIKTVDVNMRRIRQKIEDDASNPSSLKTVWGHGYIWSTE
ncbi:response regulator transcription factor [Maledivibacter halophilus]|uniref:Stage 0 sporulation protein A homolog n=1 Tax=Maledivibacter halophilus TaxID=36842 RepID=A0A1T5MAF3_9FIRM|nr:response regulator transcription factor [Maledivibacter halophilus]SKC85227.1 DNA-binding response regulator, OmpR family, contains REC and winged-helix (wHTH) domain [Maledivibacter halophilus]